MSTSSSASSASSETVTVTETRVACDGGGGALGHPKVYLEIKADVGEIVCPYCSRRFVLGANAAPAGH